jgi:hypothetical protein
MRATPLRAALLALAWSLPAVWCAGHLIAHAIESGHHQEHEEHAHATGDRISRDAISHDHDHAHHHPERPPAVSAESTKKLDAPILLTAGVEPDARASETQSLESTSIGHPASHAPAISRPRAPPIF